VLRKMLKRFAIERVSSSRTRSIVLSELSFKSLAISKSLPSWLWVSSEKPSSKLDGARRTAGGGEGALWAKREGETGASCAIVKVADVVQREDQ
jgi:hypothetical protein